MDSDFDRLIGAFQDLCVLAGIIVFFKFLTVFPNGCWQLELNKCPLKSAPWQYLMGICKSLKVMFRNGGCVKQTHIPL